MGSRNQKRELTELAVPTEEKQSRYTFVELSSYNSTHSYGAHDDPRRTYQPSAPFNHLSVATHTPVHTPFGGWLS